MAFGNSQNLVFRIDAQTTRAKAELQALDTQITRLGGGFSSAFGGAGPLAAAAAVGIASVATAAAAAGAAVFRLAAAASEYGSAIFDASQKTGLSAQMVSALKFAADQSGSSLEQISGSVAKFNVLLGEANLGSEKAQKTLEKYGITARDTDTALAQAIKTIAQMTSADQQAAAAKALFKDRTAEILPVIKSFDGDLPGLMDKLRELGVLMSDEDARASDEFGDTLDTLGLQAASVGRQFAFEMMPLITSAMQSVSDFMAENKGVAREWGQTVSDTINGAIINFQRFDNLAGLVLLNVGINLKKNESAWVDWATNAVSQVNRVVFAVVSGGLSEFFRYSAQVGADNRVAELPAHMFPGGGYRGTGGVDRRGTGGEQGGRAGRAPKARRDTAADEALRQWEKDERDRLAAAGETYREETEFFAAERAKMLAIALQYADAYNKTEDDMAGHAEMLAMQVLNNKKEALQKYMDEVGQGVKEYARAQHDMKILDLEIETQKAKHATNEQERQKKAREDEEKLHKERRKRWSEHVEYLQKIQDLADEEADRSARERAAARRKEIEGATVMGGGGYGGSIGRGMGISLPSIFGDQDQILSQAEFMKRVYADVADFAGEAIGSMVQGLADLAVQWLVTGDFSAKAALRMLAASAMHIAVESAFKGIFELAEAAAAAARYDFYAAAMHKAAASLYFKTAAVAGAFGVGLGLAARAAGGGGSGGAGGGRGSAYGNGERSNREPEPFSRVSADAYISGRRSQEQAVAKAIEKLAAKIDGMKPGDVLTVGMRQRPGAVGQQVATDIGRNAAIGRNILSKSGMR